MCLLVDSLLMSQHVWVYLRAVYIMSICHSSKYVVVLGFYFFLIFIFSCSNNTNDNLNHRAQYRHCYCFISCMLLLLLLFVFLISSENSSFCSHLKSKNRYWNAITTFAAFTDCCYCCYWCFKCDIYTLFVLSQKGKWYTFKEIDRKEHDIKW